MQKISARILILHHYSLNFQQFAAQGVSQPSMPPIYSVVQHEFFFHGLLHLHLNTLLGVGICTALWQGVAWLNYPLFLV